MIARLAWTLKQAFCTEGTRIFKKNIVNIFIQPLILGWLKPREPGTVFTKLKLMDGPNKLECLSLAIISTQVLCNTAVYFAHP